MISVVQAFEKFLHGLEITEVERAEVERRQKLLVERLTRGLGGVRESFLAGAYDRGTAVRPLHHIDLFLVLDEATHAGLRAAGPKACLEAIQAALQKDGPASKEQIERLGRAVNVRLGGVELGFDIVPAFDASGGVYAIPDHAGAGFIQVNPGETKRLVTHANERAGSKLIPVIRAARHWSAQHGQPIRGLHIEALGPKAIPTPPLNYPSALRQLFSKLADTGQRSCPDPAGVGPDIDAGMTQEDRSRLRLMLQDATRQADQALNFDRTWRAEEAHGAWRTLLGEAYPETGRK